MTYTVLSDMDGVLAHWEKRFVLDMSAQFPNYPVVPYGERPFLNKAVKASQEEKIIRERPGFYLDLEPVEGALEGLNRMAAMGIDVYICSVPSLSNPTCASDKYQWLKKHFGKEWAHKLILTKDKTLVRGNILIDDKPEVEGAQKPEWEHVVFTQSYNEGFNDKRRLDKWADLNKILPKEYRYDEEL